MEERKEMIRSYKDLKVWQKSVELSVLVYDITAHFPKTEIYGITSQIRRSAVSIASNIAEGSGRQYRNELVQFLYISMGSICELETQLIIAKRLKYIDDQNFLKLAENLSEIGKMLNGLINSLKRNANSTKK